MLLRSLEHTTFGGVGSKAEYRHNPYHDPATGRFTSGGGGSFYKPNGSLNSKDKFRMYANGGGLTNSNNSGIIKSSNNTSALGINIFVQGFSQKNLDDHWGGSHDHSSEYKGFTKAQYAARALQLIQSAADGKNILGYKLPDGTIVRYDVKTHDFVKGHPNIGISTMFKPKSKARYFHNKKRLEGGITK